MGDWSLLAEASWRFKKWVTQHRPQRRCRVFKPDEDEDDDDDDDGDDDD